MKEISLRYKLHKMVKLEVAYLFQRIVETERRANAYAPKFMLNISNPPHIFNEVHLLHPPSPISPLVITSLKPSHTQQQLC